MNTQNKKSDKQIIRELIRAVSKLEKRVTYLEDPSKPKMITYTISRDRILKRCREMFAQTDEMNKKHPIKFFIKNKPSKKNSLTHFHEKG